MDGVRAHVVKYRGEVIKAPLTRGTKKTATLLARGIQPRVEKLELVLGRIMLIASP